MTDNQPLSQEQREVELVPHNPEWSLQADEEIKRLLESLSFSIIGIYHIGSTSIPGIKAKPILDFVMEVENLEDVFNTLAEFEALGYQNKGEFGIPGRQFFTRDTNGERSHHLHVFQKGHPDIERHTIFRDFLRANPDAAREYEKLKEKLAKRFPKQSGDYTAAKSDFILSMDEVARYWLEKNQTQMQNKEPED
ncbi:MAG TPA: GrpB family protein [Chloroflexi bacterium]|nr:MAG: GrpB family protein [Chloroflexota bacterium]HDD55604.1 GrpB family protein [Chloroflexota bacterium]